MRFKECTFWVLTAGNIVGFKEYFPTFFFCGVVAKQLAGAGIFFTFYI